MTNKICSENAVLLERSVREVSKLRGRGERMSCAQTGVSTQCVLAEKERGGGDLCGLALH